MGYKDSRIQSIYQDKMGVNNARNTGWRLSKGEFVIFLDADDWWDADCLQLMVEAINRQLPLYGAAHCDWAYATPNGWTSQVHSSSFKRGPGLLTLLFENPFPIHAVLIRREALEKVDGFLTIEPGLEDWELWLAIARAGYSFIHVPSCLAFYHWRPGSYSKDIIRRRADHLATLKRLWDSPGLVEEITYLKSLTFASAYLDFATTQLGLGDNKLAFEELQIAAQYDGMVFEQLETYYRLAYANQAAIDRSNLENMEMIDEDATLANFADLFKRLAVSGYTPVQIRHAHWAAHSALGQACYSERKYAAARHHLVAALRYDPKKGLCPDRLIWLARTMLPTFMRPLLGTFKNLFDG